MIENRPSVHQSHINRWGQIAALAYSERIDFRQFDPRHPTVIREGKKVKLKVILDKPR